MIWHPDFYVKIFRSESQFDTQIFIWEFLGQDQNLKLRFLSQNFEVSIRIWNPEFDVSIFNSES